MFYASFDFFCVFLLSNFVAVVKLHEIPSISSLSSSTCMRMSIDLRSHTLNGKAKEASECMYVAMWKRNSADALNLKPKENTRQIENKEIYQNEGDRKKKNTENVHIARAWMWRTWFGETNGRFVDSGLVTWGLDYDNNMEKRPLKGNSKSIALQSLVGSINKNSIGSGGNSGSSSAGVTYQSVSKKVMFVHI